MQAAVGPGRGLRGVGQLPEQVFALRPRHDVFGEEVGEVLLVILGVGVAGVQAVALEHAPVGRVAGLHPRREVPIRRLHVARHVLQALDDERPLFGRAVRGGAGLRHSLNEEVNGAERLDRVGVERALLVAPLLVQVKLISDLRERHVAVNAARG